MTDELPNPLSNVKSSPRQFFEHWLFSSPKRTSIGEEWSHRHKHDVCLMLIDYLEYMRQSPDETTAPFKRYNFCTNESPNLRERPDGAFVRFEDIKHLLRIEHTCPACGAYLLTESTPEKASAQRECARGGCHILVSADESFCPASQVKAKGE